MFCLFSGHLGGLLLGHLRNSQTGHGKVRCMALQLRPGLFCSLQPPQSQALCPVLAPCRQGIAPCRCIQVACSCLTLLSCRHSNLRRCRAQSKDFCRQLILFVVHPVPQLCISNPWSLPLVPQILSIFWQVHLQGCRDKRSLLSNRQFCTSCSFSWFSLVSCSHLASFWIG